MHRRTGFTTFVGLICWMFLSPTVEAQITETIQKLLPATVAVELKAEQGTTSMQIPGVLQEADERMKALGLGTPIGLPPLQPEVKRVDAVRYATGTIVSADGLIVTMLGFDRGTLKVTLKDGKELPAKFVAVDRRSGLQLVKVNINDLSMVEFSAGGILLGEQVATVVCTDMSARAAATGIVTANDDRAGGALPVELIETDVQIGPMSAGAPLANLRGELIGIFVAQSHKIAGRSFAVPVKYVRELLDSQKGDEPIVLKRGYLGVSLNDEDEAVDAPYVTQVLEGSAAQIAGFEKGDTIVKINGESTTTPKRVVQIIGRHKAGDHVKITSVREGETREIDVTLGVYPEPKVYGANTPADSKPTIWLQHPLRVIVKGEDGKLWALDSSGKVPHELKATPSLQANQSQVEDQLKGYQAAIDAFDFLLKARNQPFLEQSTIRVERSDVEKQLGELTERVKSLQAEVEKLTAELKNVAKKLNDEQ